MGVNNEERERYGVRDKKRQRYSFLSLCFFYLLSSFSLKRERWG